jgi:serine phosphatase RsbU (regulator of sigma subunit)
VHRQYEWKRWRRRLIAGLMVFTLAILAGVAAFTYLAYRTASTDLVMERDRQLTYLSAARLKDEMTKYADVLTSFTRSPEIYREDLAARREALSRARFRLAVFDGGVILLDNFGKVQAATPERPEILGNDWSGSDFFREMLVTRGPYYSSALGNGPDGAPVVVVAVPILGDNNEFLGVLAGMFRLGESTVSAFYASLVRLRIGQSGDTLLVDGNGQVLYDSGYALVGSIWDLGRFPGFGTQGGAARLQDADGHDVIAAYAAVPGTRWTLITEDDWATALRPFHGYGNALLVLLALAMVLPAAGVTLLLREQNAAMVERERREQEKRVASMIRQRLLPKQVPMLSGWTLAVGYEPASETGGDFYDFMLLPDGRLMMIAGDVGVGGIAGAHTISAARMAFRGAAMRMLAPADTLEYCNTMLSPEVEDGANVSCMVAVLDPMAGRIAYASAGSVVPFYRGSGDARELQMPGPPLAVSLNTRYEQWEISISEGEFILLFSDGLVRARNTQGEAFGAERLRSIVGRRNGDAGSVVEDILDELKRFTGKGWTQEDDVTVMVLEREHNGSRKGSQS